MMKCEVIMTRIDVIYVVVIRLVRISCYVRFFRMIKSCD